jgi:uncharacterized protein (TIGR02611 family)
MFDRMRHSLRDFARHRPGQRFVSRYERARRDERGTVHRTLIATMGFLLVLLGIVLVPAPGPGFLVILAGASLMAQEMLPVARKLDAAELWLRTRLRRLRSFWRARLGPRGRAACVGAAVCMLAVLVSGALVILL